MVQDGFSPDHSWQSRMLSELAREQLGSMTSGRPAQWIPTILRAPRSPGGRRRRSFTTTRSFALWSRYSPCSKLTAGGSHSAFRVARVRTRSGSPRPWSHSAPPYMSPGVCSSLGTRSGRSARRLSTGPSSSASRQPTQQRERAAARRERPTQQRERAARRRQRPPQSREGPPWRRGRAAGSRALGIPAADGRRPWLRVVAGDGGPTRRRPRVAYMAREAPMIGPSPSAGILILNWNGAALLSEHLPSVLSAARHSGIPVAVADNGSSDDSMRMLARDFPEVRRIPLGENHGFGGGYNRAIAQVDWDIAGALEQ